MASKKGYAPQVNVNDSGENDFDDPDQYMMLVRPFRNRRIPYLQILLPLIAIICSIVGLSIDEISDGDWSFDEDFYLNDEFDEVDYDCGWNQLRFSYYWSNGYESNEKFEYSSVLCDESEDVFDSDWCKTMKIVGRVWLAFNIISIILSTISIPIVFKLGKSSITYFVLVFFAMICNLIAIGDWFKNERCTDIEDTYGDYSVFSIKTNVGASMVLAIISAGMLLLSLLVSSIHLVQKRNLSNQRQSGSMELPQVTAGIPNQNDTAA